MIGNIIASQFLSSNDWAFGSALSVILVLVVMLLFLAIGRKTKVEQIFTGGG
jgi:ABC-type spermidine/putrescine transport system permease subunit I